MILPFKSSSGSGGQAPLSMEALIGHYFQTIAIGSPVAIARMDRKGLVLAANPAFNKMTKSALEGKETPNLFSILTSDKGDALQDVLNAIYEQDFHPTEPCAVEFTAPDDENDKKLSASVYLTCMPSDEAGSEPVILAHFIDTTEQKNLEMRFAHSQKMQAVGQLAGGVAHDFNNLLTAMIGFCDLLLMRHPAGDPSFADIMQIKQNANRAANLVRQLLAFSRKQTLQPKVLDITDVLAELSHLIRRLIGENIELEMTHGRNLGLVRVDQGQLEQVIINLAVNARDAMDNGGTLQIRTENVLISPNNRLDRKMISPAAEDSITDGQYVMVEVRDTGCGIPKELIQQIFEPFFSTKEVGAGTGLGLSTVYGIIKQTEGYVYVTSETGKGTTFSIFFPRYEETGNTKADAPEKQLAPDLTGKGTILLVEDETPVRTFASRALSNKGYTVLEADSAETALDVISKTDKTIDIIISDVIMPGMTGPDMVEKVLKTHPDIKVIFISGYAEDAFVDSYGVEREFNFLPKPFTLKQLAGKVKDVLGSNAEEASS